MIDFFKTNIKDKMPKGKRGPNKKKTIDGFYKGSIRCSPTILHTEKVYSEKNGVSVKVLVLEVILVIQI